MRGGTGWALMLALGVTGCGKAADHAPEAEPSAAHEVPAQTEAPPPPPPATTPSAAAEPIVPRELRALGTEPFWGAEIKGATLTYTTPEDQTGQAIPVERRDTAIGAVFSGTLDGRPLVLTLAEHPCSDGMSDQTHPFKAVLMLGSQRRTGCAGSSKTSAVP